MKNSILNLPGFHLATLRRKPRSAQQILAQKLDDIRQKSFSQLGECFSALIPTHRLKPTQSGALSRRRVLRWLMLQAATAQGQPLKSVSFKASVQALRQWEPMLYREKNNPAQLRQLLAQLRSVIAAKLVPDRPGRGAPRVVKRRPKSYQLMTRPRAEMAEVSHRGKYGAEGD